MTESIYLNTYFGTLFFGSEKSPKIYLYVLVFILIWAMIMSSFFSSSSVALLILFLEFLLFCHALVLLCCFETEDFVLRFIAIRWFSLDSWSSWSTFSHFTSEVSMINLTVLDIVQREKLLITLWDCNMPPIDYWIRCSVIVPHNASANQRWKYGAEII